MTVSLTVQDCSGSGAVYFNILPPGSDNVAIFNSSMTDDSFAEVNLSETGDYTLRVYQMGNDRDVGSSSNFTVSATIR